jgi:nitroreductase
VEGFMLIELLRRRRSIRKFTNQLVEQDKLDILVEAMLRSPSSRGINPWQFVIVTDRKIIRKLASAKAHGSSFMAAAPLAVVVCADPVKSDVWVEDASIASLIVHLQAADLGLGSCWVQIRNRDHDEQTTAEAYVRDTLGLDQSLTVEAIVAIGYDDENKQGRTADSLLYERVSYLS